MASFVADTLADIDFAIAGYAEGVFGAFGSAVAGALQAMGLVGLALVAANSVMQVVPIRLSEFLKWGVRYVIITAVATTWAQFEPIYNILTNTPSALGAALISGIGAPDMNTALDEMITEFFTFSEVLADESGFFSISLTSVLVWVLGGLMAVAAIIVSSIAKVGLVMAVSLAPMFIPASLFRATANLFESWVRFTLGFALIPIVLAGVMGAFIMIGGRYIGTTSGAVELQEAAGFLIVGAASIFLMIQVPTMVNSLAGTVVATANGVAMATSAATLGASVVGKAVSAGTPRVAQANSAIDAAVSTPGGPQARIAALIQDARTTSQAMKKNRETVGRLNAARGERTSRAARLEAGRAAMIQAARDNNNRRRDP